MRRASRRRAVVIIKDPEMIKLLADFTRAEILRLLSDRPMTETQLSSKLGLTKAAVGYHLHLLERGGLIEISRVEAEEHGILQKYYSAIAALFIVDPDFMPDDVKRYFLKTQMEHLRGMFSVFRLHDQIFEVSSKDMEELAVAMMRQLKVVGERYAGEFVEDGDAETLRVKIYAEALANLTRQREWSKILRSA
ncbi:hypothetical protein DRO55_01340 [Candidatus Bathyarchaeota archaeon]|nr:MAG: hypothetical protein DRO55_01340 [Candidatus Bathyarchaeota archaeon]